MHWFFFLLNWYQKTSVCRSICFCVVLISRDITVYMSLVYFKSCSYTECRTGLFFWVEIILLVDFIWCRTLMIICRDDIKFYTSCRCRTDILCSFVTGSISGRSLPGYVPLLFRVVIFELLLDLVEAPLNSLSQHGLDLWAQWINQQLFTV